MSEDTRTPEELRATAKQLLEKADLLEAQESRKYAIGPYTITPSGVIYDALRNRLGLVDDTTNHATRMLLVSSYTLYETLDNVLIHLSGTPASRSHAIRAAQKTIVKFKTTLESL